MKKSWESQVLRRGLTIVSSEGNKRRVWCGFYKGIDKLVYSAGHSQHIPKWTKEFKKKIEQAVGSVKPSQSNNLGLSQA